jgi:hypothetical protein
MRKLTDKITIFRTDFGYLKAMKKSLGLPNYAETVHRVVKLADIQVSVGKHIIAGNTSSPVLKPVSTKDNKFMQIGGEKI